MHAQAGRPALVLDDDCVPAMPPLASVFDEVKAMLARSGHLPVIVLDFTAFAPIELHHGRALYNSLLADFGRRLSEMRTECLRGGDLIVALRPYGEEVAIFLEGARSNQRVTEEHLERVVDRIWSRLVPQIARSAREHGSRALPAIGQALVLANEMVQAHRLVYRALAEAGRAARDRSYHHACRAREQLRDIIVTSALSAVFQPIVDLATREVRAYEALIRGPKGSSLEPPLALFELAEHANLCHELDRACLATVLREATDLPKNSTLFVNVRPPLLGDAEVHRLLRDGWDPGRLVLELSEQVEVHRYDLLLENLSGLRARGIRVAVDDLGTAHANLEQVLELSPDFMKLDRKLVQGVAKSSIRSATVESLALLSKRSGSLFIAEGIEEEDDARALCALGADWGQGFLYGRPQPLVPGSPA
jgi:EAL domain-containing protein (putative c-di-GMP-specific phosphodiesterase class I)/GGDEF domain-containing protein